MADRRRVGVERRKGIYAKISQIRYLLVVILELNSVSEVQYNDIMIDR